MNSSKVCAKNQSKKAASFYESEIWDLRQHPDFELAKEHKSVYKKELIISFDIFAEANFREELKDFYISLIEGKKTSFSQLYNYHKYMRVFANYLSSSNIRMSSIMDKPINELLLGYRTWRVENGFQITATHTNAVSKTMERRVYEYDSAPIQIIKRLWVYVFDRASSGIPEYEKDVWDVRNLPIKVELSEVRPRYTICFDGIHQPFFKAMCKKYIYYRLQTKVFETSRVQMFALRNFSDYLKNEHPGLQSFGELTRRDIEHFFDYMGSLGLSSERIQMRIGAVKNFLDGCLLLDIPGAPTKTLITAADTKRKGKTLPKFFSDKELASLNAHIADLPQYIARMFFLLQNVGMRISEACALKEGCLSESSPGNFVLTYYQIKTKRWNSIPVNEIVASTIKAAVQESKEAYGADCFYVFAQNKDRPVSPDMFSYHMNQMSFKFNITDDAGQPLRIKSHVFRGTVATRYANLGIDMEVIKLMLGQKYLGVLKHYITIHSETMVEYLREITEEANLYIDNIGQIEAICTDEEQGGNYTPLSIGFCTHEVSAGSCPHCNACYTCRMFRPSKAHIDIYKHQLREAEKNIAIAKVNGYTRIHEINVELAQKLSSIIHSIEEMS